MLFFVFNHGGQGLYGNGYTHHCWSPTSLSAIQFSHHPYRSEWRGIHRQCYTTFLQQFETKIQQLDSIMDSCTAIQHANHAIQQSVDCIVSMQQFLKAHTTTDLLPLVHHRNSIDHTVEHHPAHHNMTTKDKKSQPTNSHKLQAMSLLLHHETLTVTPPHTLPHPVHALHSITRRSPSMADCFLLNWTCNNNCSKSGHNDASMSNPNKKSTDLLLHTEACDDKNSTGTSCHASYNPTSSNDHITNHPCPLTLSNMCQICNLSVCRQTQGQSTQKPRHTRQQSHQQPLEPATTDHWLLCKDPISTPQQK